MSWWQRPEIVSKGAQKNFAAFMAELRDRYAADWSPDPDFYRSTIALAILFKAAQARVRRAKLQSYGANVVTYLIAKLSADYGQQIDLGAIWAAQEVSSELMGVFDAWIPELHRTIASSAGSRNVTEWCKKEACWDLIKAAQLEFPDEAPPEFAVAGTDDVESEKDSDEDPISVHASAMAMTDDPVALCCRLDKAQWARIIEWAANSGEVPKFDLRVAHTISGYALDDWQQRPSAKQARFGVRVIEAARRAGILGSRIHDSSQAESLDG
jgi:hypothetical protein